MNKKSKILIAAAIILVAGIAVYFTNGNTRLFKGDVLSTTTAGTTNFTFPLKNLENSDGKYVFDINQNYVDGNLESSSVTLNGVPLTENDWLIMATAIPLEGIDASGNPITVESCKIGLSSFFDYTPAPIGSIFPMALTKNNQNFSGTIPFNQLPTGEYSIHLRCQNSNHKEIVTTYNSRKKITLIVTKNITGTGSTDGLRPVRPGDTPETNPCVKFDTFDVNSVRENMDAAYGLYAETGYSDYNLAISLKLASPLAFYDHLYTAIPGDWLSPQNDNIVTVLNRYATNFNTFLGDNLCTHAPFSYYRIEEIPTADPTITSFSPTSGPVGTTVTITGTNFNEIKSTSEQYLNKAHVRFGGTAPSSTERLTWSLGTVNSDGTTITINVPAGGQTGKIYLKHPENNFNGTYYASSTNFTVTESDTTAPTVTINTPQNGSEITPTLLSNTPTTPLSVTTNEDAKCFVTSNSTFTNGIAPLNSTDNRTHTATLNVTTARSFYVKCTDDTSATVSNATTINQTKNLSNAAQTSFTVTTDRSVDTTAPTVTINTPLNGSEITPTLLSNTPTTPLNVTTNENAKCFATSNSTFANGIFPLNSTDNRTHTATLNVTTARSFYVKCTDDTSATVNNATTINQSKNLSNAAQTSFTVNTDRSTDTTAPTISSPSPTGTVTSSTTTLSVSTNEAAACRYSTTGSTFDFTSGTAMTAVGGTSHSATLSGLTNGPKVYYIKCQDNADNTSAATIVSFTVSITPTSTDTTPPTVTVVKPTSALPSGTTTTELEVSTNEAATCDYNKTSSTFTIGAWGNVWLNPSATRTTHKNNITGLTNGTNTGYVRCQDTAGNISGPLTVTITVSGTSTSLVSVTADDTVVRGADADIKIDLGTADFIAVIANIVGPNNYAKTIYYYCESSYTDANKCPSKETSKLVGPRSINKVWDTTGVAPGNYEVRISARTNNSTVYRDDDEVIKVIAGDSNNCSAYFKDMNSNSPLCKEVSFLHDRGIFLGQETNDGRVANLNGNLIRSEYFAVATRLYGRSSTGRVNYNDLLRFRDITPNIVSNSTNEWWMRAVIDLNGIVKGYGDGTLRPTQNISMAELAKVTSLSTGFVRFYDDNRQPWYADIINAYAAQRINFNPESAARRGDAVKLIYDTIQLMDGRTY